MKEHPAHDPSTIYWPGRLSALLPLVLFIGAAFQVPEIQKNGALAMAFDWVPSLNVRFDVVLDGLSLLFVLIITGIGFLVTIYADAYLAGHRQINRFFVYLQSFLLSMVGLVLSNNLILLFVFWELTTLFSFLLIGFQNESATARDSARQALLVTGGGGLLLLVGILLVGDVTGTYAIIRTAGTRRTIAPRCTLSPHFDMHPGRGLHQIGPVPLPFLVAERHGRADARECVSAFRHHGQSRHLSPGQAASGHGGHHRLDDDIGRRRRGDRVMGGCRGHGARPT